MDQAIWVTGTYSIQGPTESASSTFALPLPLVGGGSAGPAYDFINATNYPDNIVASPSSQSSITIVYEGDIFSGVIDGVDYSLTADAAFTSDGSLDLHASTVPIPPALWLFGSGLLGLIGIARRK